MQIKCMIFHFSKWHLSSGTITFEICYYISFISQEMASNSYKPLETHSYISIKPKKFHINLWFIGNTYQNI